MKLCEFCDGPADQVGFYGDDSTVVGGGLGQVAACRTCGLPLNLPADQHAGLVAVLSVAEAEAAAAASRFINPHAADLPLEVSP